jgi:hypothetical protein
VDSRGIPHLPKPGRYPYFRYAVPKSATCAVFIKESRMEFLEANQLHRKYGLWGTRHSLRTRREKFRLSIAELSVMHERCSRCQAANSRYTETLMGSLRTGRRVAAKIAFAIAGAIGGTLASPAPPGASLLRTMWTSIFGISLMRSMS